MLTTQGDSEACFSLQTFESRLKLRVFFPIPTKHLQHDMILSSKPSMASSTPESSPSGMLWNLNAFLTKFWSDMFTSGTFTAGTGLVTALLMVPISKFLKLGRQFWDYPTKPPFKLTQNDITRILHTVQFFLLEKLLIFTNGWLLLYHVSHSPTVQWLQWPHHHDNHNSTQSTIMTQFKYTKCRDKVQVFSIPQQLVQ